MSTKREHPHEGCLFIAMSFKEEIALKYKRICSENIKITAYISFVRLDEQYNVALDHYLKNHKNSLERRAVAKFVKSNYNCALGTLTKLLLLLRKVHWSRRLDSSSSHFNNNNIIDFKCYFSKELIALTVPNCNSQSADRKTRVLIIALAMNKITNM